MSDEPSWAKVHPLASLLATSFQEGGTTKYSRSDVLRALINPMAATGAAMPLIAWAKAPNWLLVGDAAAFAATLGLYVLIYLYCFIRRPDSLRSEQFELTRYAIEKHLYGDSSVGLIADPGAISTITALPAGKPRQAP